MEATKTIYDHPRYYEVMFGDRDVAAEAAFMRLCMKRYSPVPVKRVLEIACGGAPHAEEFLKAGLDYAGLDINPQMLAYAEEKLAPYPGRSTLFKSDLADFVCHVPVQFVYVLIGSLYVETEEGLWTHFDSVAEALSPGGLYFLDWCIQFEDPTGPHVVRDFEIESGDIRLKSHFDIEVINPKARVYREEWKVEVTENGKSQSFEAVETNRAIFPDEFLEFLDKQGRFELAGWFQDWDLTRPIEASGEVDRPIVILRKIR